MPLYGTLKTMPLPDLLQWLGNARKTGTLTVEFDKVSKSIFLGSGAVIGCTSDLPAERLGHFLLARGKIEEEQLRLALQLQEAGGGFLGRLLVKLGAICEAELAACLGAQAEETIYSLFEWDQAVFRFTDDAVPACDFPVDLRVEDILLRGLQRYDELQRIREVFHDRGIVLARTAKVPPAELLANPTGRRLYEAVDGERTVAGILLHVHGSEFMVTKFLFELHASGYVRVDGVREIAADTPATVEPEPVEVVATAADAPRTPPPTARTIATPVDGPVAQAVPAPVPRRALDEPRAEAADPVRTRLAEARALMQGSEFERALDVLDRLYREYPGDEALRRLTAEAEAAFVERAYRHYLPARKIPQLTRPIDALEGISPTEFFLLSRIDGIWDVKSVIQVAPLREVEALRTLKRLREQGLIELVDRVTVGG